ncbi:MAG: hypothetical protein PHV82_07665 [Victivallaceae bacterium]|nr:hypothetical protein [Victivallaceae bacterium]
MDDYQEDGEMIEFNCEKCGQNYEIDEQHAGAKAECTECGAVFNIPEASMAEEPAEPEKVKKSGLRMPDSFKEKMRQKQADSSHESPKSSGICPKCRAKLQSDKAVICTECGEHVKLGMNIKTLKTAKAAGKFSLAVGVGAAAALLSGVIWAAIAVWLKMEIGWIACLVGLLTGLAVRLVTPEHSARMGAAAVALACAGLLAGKLLDAEYLIRDTFKSFAKISGELAKVDKKAAAMLRDETQMAVLSDEMSEKGEIGNNNAEVEKLAPKAGEKPSEAYNAALAKNREMNKASRDKVGKKFKSLSKAEKAELQKKVDRLLLIAPLHKEMLAAGELPKPDESWQKLAPKAGGKPSKEYLDALKKHGEQLTANLKKVKKKLYALSEADAERLRGQLGSTVAGHISYWDKLKMVSSFWDILWFLLAVSTAWGLGSGSSDLLRRGQ